MAIIASVVNKMRGAIAFWALFTALLTFWGQAAWAQQSYAITPVTKPEDVRLLPSAAWPPPESDQGQMLIKLYYLRGLLDALQYVELDPASAARVLKAFEGLDLNGLAAKVDGYYLTDPKSRNLPPAAVVLKSLSSSQKKE